jgi:hypothetical protein
MYTRKARSILHDQLAKEDKVIQEELEKEVTRLDQREKELLISMAWPRSVNPGRMGSYKGYWGWPLLS